MLEYLFSAAICTVEIRVFEVGLQVLVLLQLILQAEVLLICAKLGQKRVDFIFDVFELIEYDSLVSVNIDELFHVFFVGRLDCLSLVFELFNVVERPHQEQLVISELSNCLIELSFVLPDLLLPSLRHIFEWLASKVFLFLCFFFLQFFCFRDLRSCSSWLSCLTSGLCLRVA